MRVKMKLTAQERRDGVDLRDVLGPSRAPRRKRIRASAPKPVAAATTFRPIEFVETTLYDTTRDKLDETGGVRLNCTASAYTYGEENARWDLQVRAKVKKKSGGSGKHFAIGTASMSREDLVWLRSLIDAELKSK
jgi:hypothetical protein